jgi:hypothetical protein
MKNKILSDRQFRKAGAQRAEEKSSCLDAPGLAAFLIGCEWLQKGKADRVGPPY